MTEVTGPAGQTLAVVADLHLAAGDDDPFTDDRRFATAVADLVSSVGGERFRLVLLGDTFDFPAVTLQGRRVTPATLPQEATQKVERIIAAHPTVMAALGGVVAAGHRIDLVAGNHDMELVMPPVQERLREALGADQDAVRIHPWMLYVPEVLYAEHGQQHHDFNRFPWLGAASPPASGRLPVPAGSYVDELSHLRRRQPTASAPSLAMHAARMGTGVVAGLLRLSRAERHRDERERRLAATVRAGLPPAAVVGIDRAGAATPTSIARRAAEMAVRRFRPQPAGHPGYMEAAAHAVHRVLQAHGCAVPFYAFGHTHVAADVPLGDGSPARYVNPGTWSSMTRSTPGGDRRCEVLVIRRAASGQPEAELRSFA